jgi:hypothetical protein
VNHPSHTSCAAAPLGKVEPTYTRRFDQYLFCDP